jgi:hypothetical protein
MLYVNTLRKLYYLTMYRYTREEVVDIVIDRILGIKEEYVLKGKREDGKWEEIDKFEKRVSWAEVRYSYEKDLCEEYTHIVLYNKKTRKVEWSKRCASASERLSKDVDTIKMMVKGVTDVMHQMMSLQSSVTSQILSLQNTMMNMTNALIQSSQKRSLADELAEYYQLKKVIKLILEEEGLGLVLVN